MPSYPKFPRSNVPGQIPDSLEPGSFAVNWADRKIFVGSPTGVPQLVGFPLRDFRDTSAYRVGDVVIQNGRIWRCRVAFLSPNSFNENDWTDLTAGSIDGAKELTSSVLLSGGDLTAPGGVVTAAAGTGIQMDVGDITDPDIVLLSWSSRTVEGPYAPNATLVAAITGGGLLTLTPAAAYTGAPQRTTIRVGTVTTNDLGAVVTVSSAPRAAHQTNDTLTDLLCALGPFKCDGLDLLVAAPDQITVTAGEAFWAGANWTADKSRPNVLSIAAPLAPQIRVASRNGYEISVPSASTDFTQWDNSGVIQAVPAGRYTNQFVLLDKNRDAVLVLGQQTHASRTGATDAIAAEWADLALPAVAHGLLLLGCFTSNADSSDQIVTTSNVRVGAPFGGGGGGGSGDLSLYILADGSRAMTGDLDLGGNNLIGGFVDGSLVEIAPRQLGATGTEPALLDTDLSINVPDRKIFYGDETITQKVEEFDPLRAYVLGDLVIESALLYRCTEATVAPGAFDVADWEEIGGGGGGSLAGALIKDPTTGTRNEVDLTGVGGTAKALSVVLDASQGVDVADFGPRASINRFGVPEKSFGGAVFVVSQATHGFTVIGTPLFYNGVNWLLADDTLPTRFPHVVIAEIIDANNFTVQVAGRISNLNPAAFVGGVITPGTYYYASGTAGLLTSTPGPTPVPVLYTTSATTALVKLTGTVVPTVLTVGDVVNALYPVGSLYLSVDPTNPGTRYPGTTWVAHAQGRALVGVGTADGEAWTVGQLKGSASVTLTSAQMPVHSHGGSVSVLGSTATQFLQGSFDIPRQNSSETEIISNASGIVTRSEGDPSNLNKLRNDAGGADRVRVNINATHAHVVTASGSFTTGNAGGGTAHGNIQPSIGVFVWRRTA